MSNYILAGAIKGTFKDQSTGQIIWNTRTLQESALSLSTSNEMIRGGLSNPVLGQYFYDAMLEANITDALFDLGYMASIVGGNVSVGGNALTEEAVTVTTANTITVTGTPETWQSVGTIGWYSIQGSDTVKTPITFVGQDATVQNLPVGTKLCVTYMNANSSAKQFIIPSSYIPKEGVYELEAALFNAGSDTNTSSSQVGKLIVTIPRFQLTGNTDLSITSSGASTTNLSGTALASYANVEGCTGLGQYATMQVVLFDGDWTDGLIAMAVNDADFTLATNGTQTLSLIGIYDDGSSGLIDNANLTFTSGTTATATVSTAGVVSAVASGTSDIKIVATNKTSIEAYAKVTVS